MCATRISCFWSGFDLGKHWVAGTLISLAKHHGNYGQLASCFQGSSAAEPAPTHSSFPTAGCGHGKLAVPWPIRPERAAICEWTLSLETSLSTAFLRCFICWELFSIPWSVTNVPCLKRKKRPMPVCDMEVKFKIPPHLLGLYVPSVLSSEASDADLMCSLGYEGSLSHECAQSCVRRLMFQP